MPRQVVGELEPGRLRANEDVQARAHAGIAVDRAERQAEALGVRELVPEQAGAATPAEAAGDAGGGFVARDLLRARRPGQRRVVWVLGQDGKPERRRITVGLSDGSATEVVEGDLNEGDMVITGPTLTSNTSTSNTQTPPGFGNAPRTGAGAGGRGGRR